MAQPDFIDSHIADGTRRSSKTVNKEDAHARQSQKCFSCPLLNQLGRDHGEGCERPSVTVNVNGAKRDKCLASTALRDDPPAPGLIPPLYHANHPDRLGRKRLSDDFSPKQRAYTAKLRHR